MDPVSKWLYLTRPGVLPMTLVAGAVAGLLADLPGRERRVGLVHARGRRHRARAHGEQPDERPVRPRVGTDREDYPRNLYSPHPVLSGVITRTGLAACALVVNVLVPQRS